MSNCPTCGGATKVVDSRVPADVKGRWRRRQCLKCEHPFSTIEITQAEYVRMKGAAQRSKVGEHDVKLLAKVKELFREVGAA